MKMRRDFVTNSSSSSFIIAYNNIEDIISDLQKVGTEYSQKAVTWVIDVLRSERNLVSKEDLKPILEKECSNLAMWDVYFAGYDDESDVGKAEYKRSKEKYISYVKQRIKNKKHIQYISWDDGSPIDSVIEHNILPKVAVAVYSHH